MIVKHKFPSEYELDDKENDRHRSSFKVKSLFQIMYYHGIHGWHKTFLPLEYSNP